MADRNSTRSGEPRLTDAQRRAIESDSDRIAVRAGPGSGKTAVLVERVTRRVIAGRLDLSRTLAITFTENAAAEMKDRLARSFEKSEREDLRRQLETAWISTIHGFCARLLRDNAVAAGVDPRFQVLDEVHSALLKQELLRRLLEQWDRQQPGEFLQFIHHFKRKDYDDLLLSLYDTVRGLGYDPGDRALMLKVNSTFDETLRQAVEELRALEASLPDRLVARYHNVMAALRQIAAERSGPAAVFQHLESAQKEMARRQGDEARQIRAILARLSSAAVDLAAAPHRERVAGLVARLDQDYTAAKMARSALDFDDLERAALRMLQGTPALLDRVRTRFDEILVDEFQDTSPLQSEIIHLLAGEPGLRPGPASARPPGLVPQSGRRLFVVGDPAQSIYAFRNADPRAFEAVWLEAQPPDGRIDLREDFRSRPEIINAVNLHFRGPFAGVGTPFDDLAPGSAFRSKTVPSVELLLVGDAGEEGVSGTRQTEARYLARRIQELVESGTRITHGDEPDRTLEYGDIALLFRSTTDIKIYERALDEAGLPYFSETGRGFYQAAEVRDVLSFLRVLDNGRNETALASVLRSPMYGLSDDALFLLADGARQQGVSLCDALVEAAALPELPPEDAARLRAFRKLFMRLSAERPWRSLAELIRAIVSETGFDAILLLAPNGRRKLANVQKLAEIADSIEGSGFESSLSSFIRAFDRFHYQEVREGEAQLDGASENAVRLMTMHGSKGLQFPVVILPDLSRTPNVERDYLDFLPQFGIGVQFNLATGLERYDIRKTGTLEGIRAELDVRERAERFRVLFVACTRAREHLVLSGCLKEKNGASRAEHALAEFCRTFGIPDDGIVPDGAWHDQAVGAGQTAFEVRWTATEEQVEGPGIANQAVAVRYRTALEAGASLNLPVDSIVENQAARLLHAASQPLPDADSSDFLAACTDVMEFRACPRRYYLSRYLGYDTGEAMSRATSVVAGPGEPQQAEESGHDEFPRSELGRGVHRLLAEGPAALELLPASLRDEAQQLASVFLNSEYGARTVSADVRRELPVFARIETRPRDPGPTGHPAAPPGLRHDEALRGARPENAGAQLETRNSKLGFPGARFLRGNLDLLQFDNGVPVLLLDYKANDITAGEVPETAEHYRPQMLLYSLLVEAVFGARPGEVVLFFLVPGVAWKVEVTAEALKETRLLLDRFFEAQRTCSFPLLVAQHCYRCSFRGNLCPVGI